jgi:hypothetical protein
MAVAADVTAAAPSRPPNVHTLLLAIPALATIACLVGAIGFLVWTSTRGLDITDEGMYLLSTRYPADVAMTSSGFHVLLHPLFRLVGWNVAAFRVAGFIITALSALTLTAGAAACRSRLNGTVDGSWVEFAAEASAVAVGALLGYSLLLTTPSYNWITNWGLSVSAGTTLATLARGGFDRRAAILSGVTGAALAAVFFAKFTAAVAAGGLFAAVLLAWPLAPIRVRVRWVAGVAAGFVFGAVVYFTLFQSPDAWQRMFRLGLWSARTQTPLYGSGALTRYWVSWRDDLVVAWLKDFSRVFYALIALAAVIWIVPRRGWPTLALRVAAWAGLGYAAYLSALHVRDYPPVLYQYDVTRTFFGWLLLLGPLALAWSMAGRSVSSDASSSGLAWPLIVLLLFALPFCGAVGTNLPLQYGMRYTLAPWFALFAIVLGRLSAPGRLRWAVPVGLAFLAASALVYIVKGPLEAPYRLLTPLKGQTEETALADGTTLKLDPALRGFIADVRRAAQASGFRPGDDILGFYDMPGIVYALGGRSPAVPWWTTGYPGSRLVSERALTVADRDRVRRAFILQTASSTAWLQSLRAQGVNFPDDYVLGGTFTIPFAWTKEEVKWWRPASR